MDSETTREQSNRCLTSNDRYYIVDYIHANKYSNLWAHHTGGMVGCIVDDIKEKNPDKILIFSGSEMDIDLIYGDLYYLLADWCVNNNKKIHVFVPAMPYNVQVPNHVEIHIGVQTYDFNNFDTIIDHYRPIKPNEESDDINLGQVVSNPSLLFTCYNNRPCNYRSYLIDQLAKHYLLYNSITTYKWGTETLHPDSWLYYDGDPKLVDEENIKYKHVLPRKYLLGAIDVVTESRIGDLEFYMSEKTTKPLIALKPFLVLGAPGYHKWLRDHKGIQLYEELFDYSFDDELNYKKRAKGIVENIIRLTEIYKTPDDYKTLIETIKHKAKRNLIAYMDHVFSGKSILHSLPKWLDDNTILEIVHSTNHFGTLGSEPTGDILQISELIKYQARCTTWKRDVRRNEVSLYQYILNL